jgi:hypothetical protein
MDIFTPSRKENILDILYKMAEEKNLSAIKLYLDLCSERTPSESPDLSFEQALKLLSDVLTNAQSQEKSPSGD